jgi:hypothetical protein
MTLTRTQLDNFAAELKKSAHKTLRIPTPSTFSLVMLKNGDVFSLHYYKLPYDGCGDECVAYTFDGQWRWSVKGSHCKDVKILLS